MVAKINLYIHTNIKSPIKHSDGGFIYVAEYWGKKEGDHIEKLKDPITLNGKSLVHGLTAKEAEVEALIAALGRFNLKMQCELTIYAENLNLISTLRQEWYKLWHDAGWIKADGKEPVADAERWQRLYDALAPHTIYEVTCEPHSYTSWMHNEIESYKPDTKESVEVLIKSIADAELNFKRYTEPLEKSDILENEEVQKAISAWMKSAFEFIKPHIRETNTGYVRIINPENGIKSQCEGAQYDNSVVIKGANDPSTEEMGSYEE
jgi:ribonuclease HI